jgi:hypothetical protein
MVSHLIMLGTPNAGSPWPQVQAGVTAALAFALNGLSVVAAPLKLLEGLLKRAETIDVSLDQMEPGSDFLTEMAKAKDPGIPYTLVVGNTSLVPEDKAAGLKKRILHKLGKVVEIPFFNQPNDIAVLVESITALPAARSPLPKQLPTACNHLEYFVHPAGLASLSAAVVGTGITAASPPNRQPKLRGEPVEQVSQPSASATASATASTVASPTAVSAGSNPWILGLIALALAGLGLYVWSAIADTTPPPPATESEVSNLKI